MSVLEVRDPADLSDCRLGVALGAKRGSCGTCQGDETTCPGKVPIFELRTKKLRNQVAKCMGWFGFTIG